MKSSEDSIAIAAAFCAEREAAIAALPPAEQAIERQRAVVEKYLRKADRARYNAMTEAANAARYDKEARFAHERLEMLILNKTKQSEVSQ